MKGMGIFVCVPCRIIAEVARVSRFRSIHVVLKTQAATGCETASDNDVVVVVIFQYSATRMGGAPGCRLAIVIRGAGARRVKEEKSPLALPADQGGVGWRCTTKHTEIASMHRLEYLRHAREERAISVGWPVPGSPSFWVCEGARSAQHSAKIVGNARLGQVVHSPGLHARDTRHGAHAAENSERAQAHRAVPDCLGRSVRAHGPARPMLAALPNPFSVEWPSSISPAPRHACGAPHTNL